MYKGCRWVLIHVNAAADSIASVIVVLVLKATRLTFFGTHQCLRKRPQCLLPRYVTHVILNTTLLKRLIQPITGVAGIQTGTTRRAGLRVIV